MAAVCALQPIPIHIPHTSRRDRKYVLRKKMTLYIGIQPGKLACNRLINVTPGELAPTLITKRALPILYVPPEQQDATETRTMTLNTRKHANLPWHA